jgi:hypothetical protein
MGKGFSAGVAVDIARSCSHSSLNEGFGTDDNVSVYRQYHSR